MKKLLAAFLCFTICASFSPSVLAEMPRDLSFETSIAAQLSELGLFRGIEENVDGATEYDLSRELTRTEALVMLIRMLGKETEAKVYSKSHPFSDVPEWVNGYVSYAYDQGLTNGVSKSLFGSEIEASAEIYLTFMLRALGYSDGDGGEFSWDAPWALAAWCGILPTQVDRTRFLRADAVSVACATLYANLKGKQNTLHEKLETEEVFTDKQFESAFSCDPFEGFRMLDKQIENIISVHEVPWLSDNNTYTVESHIITDVTEESGVLTVSVLVCCSSLTLNKGDVIGNNGGIGTMWLIELDAANLSCLSCRTENDLIAEGKLPDEYISKETLSMLDSLSKGMRDVCRIKLQTQIDSGLIKYKQPDYSETLEKVISSLSLITQTIAANTCTILLGELGGTPHEACTYLYLVFKPDSALEGETIQLPMPRKNFIGITTAPDKLWLSEDGFILYYSYYFEESLVIDEGLPSEIIVHEAGTYSYTVDLMTGEVSLSIIPD